MLGLKLCAATSLGQKLVLWPVLPIPHEAGLWTLLLLLGTVPSFSGPRGHSHRVGRNAVLVDSMDESDRILTLRGSGAVYEPEKNHWIPEGRTLRLCLPAGGCHLVLHRDFRLLLGQDTGSRTPQLVLIYSNDRPLTFETN